MGYQVGRVCHFTHEAATNELMTHVVPTIDKDGVLHHPVFNGTTWQYKQQQINLTFPECDPLEYQKAGRELGIVVVGILAAAYVVNLMYKLILSYRERENEE
ncbi:hypothetical protein [Neisseria dentiae]|uniref:hypothetical protein n=1 Tax=Neisseria dentiae TaxID=194197 RepID=UPI0035A1559F